MIYLLGGAPRIGKSVIAQQLAIKTGATLVATDDVRRDVFESTPIEQQTGKFPLPGFSGNASENTFSVKDRVQLQLTEARSIQSEVKNRIMRALSNNEDLIIEGVHVLPIEISEIMKGNDPSFFKTIFVGSSNIDRILAGMEEDMNPNNWLKEADADVKKQVGIFTVGWSEFLKQETDRLNLAYFERTDDFKEDSANILKQLS